MTAITPLTRKIRPPIMSISIVQTRRALTNRRRICLRLLHWLFAFALPLATPIHCRAQTVFGPWVPIFKGIDHAVGTNTPGSGAIASNLQVVNALRVDLTDPDIQLY